MKLTVVFVVLLSALALTHARGQSALDGFDPHANGAIRVAVQQPDGKILIGGDFTTIRPNNEVAFKRNHIARLNIDGTLDLAFNPDANDRVRSIVVQPDGNILVGGDFTAFNSQSPILRNFIARLDRTTGAVDGTFIPNANSIVRTIVLQGDGKVLVGGDFVAIGGQGRGRIARLSLANGAADGFNPNAIGGKVTSIAFQKDGRIVVGGSFNAIGGQTRFALARLSFDGILDATFDPSANGDIFSIALQVDGKILIGGSFTTVAGKARSHIARLDSKGGLDSFDPNADGEVLAITIQTDTKIVLGGAFMSVGGQTHNRLARLNPTGTVDNVFTPSASSIDSPIHWASGNRRPARSNDH